MIPPLAWLLFVLVPLGGVLLAVGIRTVRRSFFGPLVAELAMDGGATTFTVHALGFLASGANGRCSNGRRSTRSTRS